jgi:hypothetical protein
MTSVLLHMAKLCVLLTSAVPASVRFSLEAAAISLSGFTMYAPLASIATVTPATARVSGTWLKHSAADALQ